MQQHQISKDDAIKVAALHFGGKAYAWWIFEYFALNNANISSYARFIKALVGRFDGNNSETHEEKKNKIKQTKTLHVMDETINSIPLQKNNEEANILYRTLLEARHLSHVPKQKDMEVSS